MGAHIIRMRSVLPRVPLSSPREEHRWPRCPRLPWLPWLPWAPWLPWVPRLAWGVAGCSELALNSQIREAHRPFTRHGDIAIYYICPPLSMDNSGFVTNKHKHIGAPVIANKPGDPPISAPPPIPLSIPFPPIPAPSPSPVNPAQSLPWHHCALARITPIEGTAAQTFLGTNAQRQHHRIAAPPHHSGSLAGISQLGL
jgi:hypothetical protein